MREVDEVARALADSIAEFERAADKALSDEVAQRRKAELENLVLRAELSAVCRKYNARLSAPVAQLFTNQPSTPPPQQQQQQKQPQQEQKQEQQQELSMASLDGIEVALAQFQLHDVQPEAAASPAAAGRQQAFVDADSQSEEVVAHLAQWGRVQTALDELRARLASTDDLGAAVFLSKTVKELYNFMQTPLDKRLDMKPIPRQWAAAALTEEKVAKLRAAALQAVDEIQHSVDSLTETALPLAPLFDLQQRLEDTFAAVHDIGAKPTTPTATL